MAATQATVVLHPAAEDVAEQHEGAPRLPLGEIKGRGHWGSRSWPEEWEKERDDFRVPLVLSPDTYVVVAGGDGRHSAWMPAWSTTQRATEII